MSAGVAHQDAPNLGLLVPNRRDANTIDPCVVCHHEVIARTMAHVSSLLARKSCWHEILRRRFDGS